MSMRAEVSKAWVAATDLGNREQVQLALWLTGIEESLAWHERVVLDCLNVRRRDGVWVLRVQARRWAKGEPGEALVAWADGATLYYALWLFARQVARGEVRWKSDKYPVVD